MTKVNPGFTPAPSLEIGKHTCDIYSTWVEGPLKGPAGLGNRYGILAVRLTAPPARLNNGALSCAQQKLRSAMLLAERMA